MVLSSEVRDECGTFIRTKPLTFEARDECGIFIRVKPPIFEVGNECDTFRIKPLTFEVRDEFINNPANLMLKERILYLLKDLKDQHSSCPFSSVKRTLDSCDIHHMHNMTC